MKNVIIYLFTVLAVTFLGACSKEDDKICNLNTPVVSYTQLEELGAYIQKSHPNAIFHTEGFYYEIIAEGNNTIGPDACSEVVVNYSGSLTDGTEFDKANNITFDLKTLITGWRLALPIIKEGGIINIYLPADLAYGDAGINDIIPQGAITIFKIELLKVN